VYESNQNQNGSKSATATNGDQALAAFSRVSEDERAFTLGDLARAALKRLWVVLLVVAVAVGVAVGASLWQTPTYEASALLMVGQEQGAGQDTNLQGSVEGLQALTTAMIIAIDTRPVAEEAIRRLGLGMSPDELLNNLTIEQVETSQFIRLTYADSDAERAKEVVNTVGQVSSERISNTGATANNITATVYEKAIVPKAPASPKPLRNGILGAVLGLMLGIGLALLTEYLDHSWRSPEEVEQTSGVPTFATIPAFSFATSKKGR
jgi:capsular polysaccharide biosynthesis protein